MKVTFTTLLAIGATLASASAVAAPEPKLRHINCYKPQGVTCSYAPGRYMGLKLARDVAVAAQIQARDDGDIVETDQDLAAELAESLAGSDEDYDKQPDGVDDDTYLAELAAKDAEDDTIPASVRRDAEAEPRIPNNACGHALTLKAYKKCAPLGGE